MIVQNFLGFNVFCFLFSGRRGRAPVSIFDQQLDENCKLNSKRLLTGLNNNTTSNRTMTRRSAKIFNKSFHDQTIKKYFLIQQKASEDQKEDHSINEKSISFTSIHDNDENACDPFTAALKMPTYQTFEDVCNLGVKHLPTNHDNNVTEINSTATDHDLPNVEEGETNANNFTSVKDIKNESPDDSDGSSVTSIQPANIFLQKPVLHLNIDKSPNQASSIVINKHLEVCPNFTSTLNSFGSKIVSKSLSSSSSNGNSSETPFSADDARDTEGNEDLRKSRKTCKRRKLMKSRNSSHFDALLESDSNSCDSGVVADKSLELNGEKDNKPTTPHRILCPSTSPVKKMKLERNAKVSAMQNVRPSLLANRTRNRVSTFKRAKPVMQERKITRR